MIKALELYQGMMDELMVYKSIILVSILFAVLVATTLILNGRD